MVAEKDRIMTDHNELAARIERAAIEQNSAMRQELAHVGNLVSDLAAAMGVDQANDDGSWPDLAGRLQKLIDRARSAS